ncbi:OprD family outer membrane porin [Endozoicomonas elysicola]|uniref:Porin n=1 Tax=Endozoicomonas elysicola TaxID=305900 RepID=A0A081K599_9GAMM|nr:OprD family outer membrane porin [Endozoicomonas elysicola]KEI69325.1 hypothetical protein GV64_24575 [Endozoicomonas elysicola]
MFLSVSQLNKSDLSFQYKPIVFALSLLVPTMGFGSDGSPLTLFEEGEFSLMSFHEMTGLDEWDKDAQKHTTSYAALGALMLDYESGYVGDNYLSMGFGLGGSFTYKLSQRNPDTSLGGSKLGQTDCVTDPQKGTVNCEGTTNDAKLSQANIRIKAGKKKKRSLNATIGIGYFDAGMIESYDPDSDLTPVSYSGFAVNGRWDDIDLSAAMVTGMMKKSATSIEKLGYKEDITKPSSAFVHIDHVGGVSLIHKLDSFGYTLGYSYAEGFKHRYLAHAKYSMDIMADSRLQFDAAHSLNQHRGKNWDEAIKKGMEEEGADKAYLTTARLRYLYQDDFRLGFGWSTTGGNMNFNTSLAGVDALEIHYGQGFIEKFRGLNNTSQRFEIAYWPNNFDTPILRDLRLRYQYVWGDDEYAGHSKNEKGKAQEHIFDVVYTKPSGSFAGTSVTLKVGKLFADDVWAKVADGEPDDVGDIAKFKLMVSIPIL